MTCLFYICFIFWCFEFLTCFWAAVCLALSFITWFGKQLFSLRSAHTHTHLSDAFMQSSDNRGFYFQSFDHQIWSLEIKMIDLLSANAANFALTDMKLKICVCVHQWVRLPCNCSLSVAPGQPLTSRAAPILLVISLAETGSSCLGVSLTWLVLSALQGDNNKLRLANWLMGDE